MPYVALNPLSTRSASHRDPTTPTDLRQVDFAVHSAAALLAVLGFAHFQPSTEVMSLHVARRLPQVYHQLAMALNETAGAMGHDGARARRTLGAGERVLGRFLGALKFLCCYYSEKGTKDRNLLMLTCARCLK